MELHVSRYLEYQSGCSWRVEYLGSSKQLQYICVCESPNAKDIATLAIW